MTRFHGWAAFLGAGLLLAATGAAAQAWRGEAGLEVRVASRKGGPLAGARVELIYRDGPDGGGPAAVATDARGRAVVGGLAAGTWQLEVSHPDFMSYVAVLALRPGAKPQITASFLEASGKSTAPIQVKLTGSRGGASSPPLPAAPEPPQQPVPATAPDEPAPDEPARDEPAAIPEAEAAMAEAPSAAPRSPQPPPADIPAGPAPEPAPTEPPAASAETAAPVTPTGWREVPTPAVAAPENADPGAPPPAPVPPPEPAPVLEPTPEPPPAPDRKSTRLNSSH